MAKIRTKARRKPLPVPVLTSVMDIIPLLCAYEAAIGTNDED
jgi:hypothetical protein